MHDLRPALFAASMCLLILTAAWLVWRRPDRERLAFGLLVVSGLIMTALFLIGTHTSLIPGLNL